MLWAILRIKLSVINNQIKCKRSVNLKLTCHPTIPPSCISYSHLCLTNFVFINKHHDMETLLYVTTVTGHFLSARVTYKPLLCSGQFVLDVIHLLSEGKYSQHLLLGRYRLG